MGEKAWQVLIGLKNFPIIWEYMERLEELKKIADGVRKDLDKRFRFDYYDSEVNAYVGDASMEGCMREFLAMERLRGAPESEVKRQMEHLSNPGSGACIYIGDVSDTDYAVFVNGVSEATPILLGEEITHGEHVTEHVRRLGSLEGFYREFGHAAPELLGYLGMHIMAKKLASAGNAITLDTSKTEGAHKAGYTYASRLINSGKEILYPDIFHAKNRKEIWDIMKDITGP